MPFLLSVLRAVNHLFLGWLYPGSLCLPWPLSPLTSFVITCMDEAIPQPSSLLSCIQLALTNA